MGGILSLHSYEPQRTFWHIPPMKIQISMCILAVWSVYFVHMDKF